ncbi:MAG: hypothetical protein V3V74_07630 [Nitrosomonadaceae bacterium]
MNFEEFQKQSNRLTDYLKKAAEEYVEKNGLTQTIISAAVEDLSVALTRDFMETMPKGMRDDITIAIVTRFIRAQRSAMEEREAYLKVYSDLIDDHIKEQKP